jgi:hypothetical protein
MDMVIVIELIDEGIPLLLLTALGTALYQGLNKNQTLLSEREELLKRYLLYRGDKQIHLKTYEEDEKVYQELIKNLSASWKKFKKIYDQYLLSFAQNTSRTRLFLQIITLGLLANSVRFLVSEFLFSGFKPHFLYSVVRELSNYVLVVLSFILLRAQTHRFLPLKGDLIKMEREILFFPNSLLATGNYEGLYDEFDPLEGTGAEDGKEDQDSRR